jgi:mRNA interferase RelE/StbE
LPISSAAAADDVLIPRSAAKAIDPHPIDIRRLVVRRILALADEPRPHGSQKLTGEEKYRIRRGEDRVVHTIEDAIVTVTVVHVAHRSDVHR